MFMLTPRSLRARVTVAGGTLLTVTMFFLTGCGGSQEQQPVSSANSEYQADDDGGAEGNASAKSSYPASGEGENAPGRTNGAVPSNNATPRGDSTNATANPTTQPPVDPSPAPMASKLAEMKVPEGGAEQLVAFLDEVDQYFEDLRSGRVQGMNQQESALREVTQTMQLKLDATNRLLAQPELDEQAKARAIESKLVALSMLSRLGDATADAQMNDFAQDLLKDPATENQGRLILFGHNIDRLSQGQLEDKSVLLTDLEKILQGEKLTRAEFSTLRQAALMLLNSGEMESGQQALAMIRDKFVNHPDEELAKDAATINDQLDYVAYKNAWSNLVSDENGDMDAMIAAAKKFMANGPDVNVFSELASDALNLEYSGQTAAAGALYDLIRQQYANSENADLAAQAKETLANSDKRLGLLGKPFAVTGTTMDGEPLDTASLEGKVVLVDFWATWCGPCRAEFPNMKEAYAKYKDKGFEIIGVNLDDTKQQAAAYLEKEPLPWTNIRSENPDEAGFSNPNAVQAGVEAIPFLVLVGKDGNVAALHTRGQQLDRKLEELLGGAAPATPTGDATPDAASAPASDPAAEKTPAPLEPATELNGAGNASPPNATPPNALRPSSATPDANDQSQIGSRSPFVFVSLRNDDEQRDAEAGDSGDGNDADRNEAEGDKPLNLPKNPYLAPADLSDLELTNFLLDMSEKPKSIRYREGFAAAVVDAADRLLAADTKEKYQVIAAEAKFDILHRDACLGDEAADKALNEFVDQMKDDSREKIARQVKFFLEERQAIAAETLPADQIPGALEELKGRIAEQSLSARHLRMASAIVAAINRLEDGDQREKLFAEFGGLFAKSDDKQLARYGKKLAKPSGAAEDDKLVGQKLELDGITALNQPFDWASYRGKVVLVDFWATWCGPCRREMPHVRELHQKLKERGFDVVGVNLDQDEEALARYLEDNDAPWVNLVGERSQELAQQYGVRGIPTMILVDQNGTIVATSHQVGTLVEKAEKLLANPPAAEGAKDAEQPKAN